MTERKTHTRARLKASRLLLPVLALVIVWVPLAVAGCGGGGGSGTFASSSPEGEPSAQFLQPKGKNTIVKFGEEASAEQREKAGAVLTENLEARQSADFTTQCATMNKKGIAEVPGAKNEKGCPKALQQFAEPLSNTKAVRKNTLSGPITAMRVEGPRGYALFHGNDGKNWAMPMEEEGGKWKVSSIKTIELPTKEAKIEPPQQKGV